MSDILVSVIVPVYNVEKYLPQCLESFTNQSFHDFEVLLIDDGSPDACGVLCDEFQKCHEEMNISVFHKENAGVQEARNDGIRAAKGMYLTFVDSDDWLEPDALENLYRYAEKHSFPDIVTSGENSEFVVKGSIVVHKLFDKEFCTFDPQIVKQLRQCVLVRGRHPAPALDIRCLSAQWTGHGVLYKTCIVKDNNIRFLPECKTADDVCFNFTFAGYAKSYAYTDVVTYNYRYVPYSISNKANTVGMAEKQAIFYECMRREIRPGEASAKHMLHDVMLELFTNTAERAGCFAKDIQAVCESEEWRTILGNMKHCRPTRTVNKLRLFLIEHKLWVLLKQSFKMNGMVGKMIHKEKAV